MAKRLNLTIEPGPGLRVLVANGVKLCTQRFCRVVLWEAQGYQCTTDFLVLSVKGFDLVLGVQWLLSLGPIIWDFSNLTMEFKYRKQTCVLRGTTLGSVQIVPSGKFSKCLSLVGNGPSPMLLASCEQTVLTLPTKDLPPELQSLLNDFDDVFQIPTRLPPARLHDHKIPLTDESRVVKVRPYRYPAVQKSEIEKLIREMLQVGVIRDSNSPFTSPVVMVKKKMGVGAFALTIDSLISSQLRIGSLFLLSKSSWTSWDKLSISLSWIYVRDIIKFVCASRTFLKRPSKLMKGTMNFWSCHLA